MVQSQVAQRVKNLEFFIMPAKLSPLVTKIHTRLDLERRGRLLVTPADYRRTLKVIHDATCRLDLPISDPITRMMTTCLDRACLVDLQGGSDTHGRHGTTLSVVSNYVDSIRDDRAKLLAWWWVAYIDQLVNRPYTPECRGVYIDALEHTQPVGLLSLINTFGKLSYHMNEYEQRRLVEELGLVASVFRSTPLK
jgi:hypothetical protein